MVAHEEDTDLIGYLEDLGIDPSRPRELNVCLVFRDRPAAEATSLDLQALGFATRLEEVPAPVLLRWIVRSEWTVTGTMQSSTDIYAMAMHRRSLEKVARDNGGTYDGWYVDVDDDKIALVETQGKRQPAGVG